MPAGYFSCPYAAPPGLDEASYEELLQLEDVRVPASAAALQSLPTFTVKAGTSAPPCSICMMEYEAGEQLTSLPCAHSYHSVCIEKWLKSYSKNCPICKHSLE